MGTTVRTRISERRNQARFSGFLVFERDFYFFLLLSRYQKILIVHRHMLACEDINGRHAKTVWIVGFAFLGVGIAKREMLQKVVGARSKKARAIDASCDMALISGLMFFYLSIINLFVLVRPSNRLMKAGTHDSHSNR